MIIVHITQRFNSMNGESRRDMAHEANIILPNVSFLRQTYIQNCTFVYLAQLIKQWAYFLTQIIH